MKKVIIAGLFFTPAFAFARLENVSDIVTSVGRIINICIPIVAALALLYFFYGLAQFILHSDDSDAQKEGKSRMIYGIVALFVIVAVWGLVGFIGDALNITTDNPGNQQIPGVNIRP